jgi:hypothetical protein
MSSKNKKFYQDVEDKELLDRDVDARVEKEVVTLSTKTLA